MKRPVALALALMALSSPALAQQKPHHPKYDYPTSARADYVIGCLASNDFKRELLDHCSCGIDTIADSFSGREFFVVSRVCRD